MTRYNLKILSNPVAYHFIKTELKDMYIEKQNKVDQSDTNKDYTNKQLKDLTTRQQIKNHVITLQ